MGDSQEIPPKIGAAGWHGQASPSRDASCSTDRGRLLARLRRGVAVLALVLPVACAPDEGTPREDEIAAADSMAAAPRYSRELVFLGRREEEPLVAALGFRARDTGTERARELRGWVAHGSRWEPFLDEQWTSEAHGSAWTIVPHGPLRVAAGGPAELEALWYSRGGRNLRLDVGRALAQLNHGTEERAHLFTATVRMGGETASGMMMELLQLQRPGREGAGARDHLLLTSGDSLTLFVASGAPREGPGIAWLQTRTGTREWNDVRLSHYGGRPVPEARREIPQGWEIEIPEAGLRVELSSLGFDAEIGRERVGLRAVDARYTVSGSIDIRGRRADVAGTVLHQVD